MKNPLGILLDTLLARNGRKTNCWDKKEKDVLLLLNATPDLLEACEANAAWFKAESEQLGSFHDRTNLCSYSEYMTKKALAKVAGEPFDEKWEGVPQILIDIKTLTPELVCEQGKPEVIAKAKHE